MAKREIELIAVDSKIVGERCIFIAVCSDGSIWKKQIPTCDCENWVRCEDIPEN